MSFSVGCCFKLCRFRYCCTLPIFLGLSHVIALRGPGQACDTSSQCQSQLACDPDRRVCGACISFSVCGVWTCYPAAYYRQLSLYTPTCQVFTQGPMPTAPCEQALSTSAGCAYRVSSSTATPSSTRLSESTGIAACALRKYAYSSKSAHVYVFVMSRSFVLSQCGIGLLLSYLYVFIIINPFLFHFLCFHVD